MIEFMKYLTLNGIVTDVLRSNVEKIRSAV
jgi:hypothetical protein